MTLIGYWPLGRLVEKVTPGADWPGQLQTSSLSKQILNPIKPRA